MKTAVVALFGALLIIGAAFLFANFLAQKAQTVQKPESAPAPSMPAPLGEQIAPQDLTEDMLMNATYGPYVFKGGAYIGASSTCSYSEARFGDFDADGLADAAVGIYCEEAGGAIQKEIHLQLNKGGSAVWAGGIHLQNGVEWKGMKVGPGVIDAEFRGLPGQAEDSVFESRKIILKGGDLIFAPFAASTSTRVN